MSVRNEPEIENISGLKKGADYTKITFSPDLSKFGMKSLTQGDIVR